MVDFDTLPAAAHEARPWVRWWWPGGAVDDAQLAQELAWMGEAGFGGVEVQAFDAALDPTNGPEWDARQRDVRSAAFIGHVRAALDAAAQHDMRVDLTVGSGWPVGGAHVPHEDALTTLMWWESTVQGPIELDVVPEPSASVFFEVAELAESAFGERLARFLPELAQPVAAYAARVESGSRSRNWLDLDDTVVLNPASIRDLTSSWVDGRLQASLPAGKWHVVAVFSGPDGEYITLTSEPGNPYPVDHLNGDAVARSVTALLGDIGAHAAWSGLFVDSLEFKVDRLFTGDFLERFEELRGYALDHQVLAVLAQSADSFLLDAGRVAVAPELQLGPDDDRVRWDYRETVSDLFVERFAGTLASWSADRGMTLRAQNYGIDIDVIRAAGAAHIPETETLYAGGASVFYKVAAAGAHLYGRQLVGAEAFSFIQRDHMTTPQKVRAAADKLFAAGVNHLVLHGVPYPAEGAYGVTGWTPFSSPFGGASTFGSTFGERWEFFDSLPALTGYMARSQALLRMGTPRADVLIYYPFHGFPTSLALAESFREPLLGGHMEGVEVESREVPFASIASLLGPPVEDPRVTWLVALQAEISGLEDAGLTWDWINAERLAVATVADGEIRVADAAYDALLLFDVAEMPARAAEAVAGLSEAGARVVLREVDVQQSPSFAELGRAGEIQAWMARARAAGAQDVTTVADEHLPRHVRLTGSAGRVLTRTLPHGTLHFVHNPSATSATVVVQAQRCEEAVLYDAWADERWQPIAAEGGGWQLSLPAWSARFLICGQSDSDVLAEIQSSETGGVEVSGWTLEATSATGLFDAVSFAPGHLMDWREVPELMGLSGVAVFAGAFAWTGESAAELVLEDVYGTVDVTVNGTYVGRLDVAPWRMPLRAPDGGEVLRAGENTVVLRHVPPLRNELVAAAAAGAVEYAQFNGKEDSLVASGVVGPVRVVGR